jgi:transcriptional regulator with XRE-family HTH domain
MTFGENVRRYRRFNGMTQAELAIKLGYKNKASIGKIENGDADVPLSMAQRIADALNVDIMALTHGETSFGLTSHEKELISAYRNASADTQAAVCNVLGVKKTGKDALSTRA